MKLEMICTGEEVLSGQIVDTNAAWVANTMMELGIEMQHVSPLVIEWMIWWLSSKSGVNMLMSLLLMVA